MNISNNGINLIKQFEGKSLKAYHGAADPINVWTIGYGHTSAAGAPRVTSGMVITDQQAVDILRSDLRSVELAIQHLVKAPVNQNQFDALVSFVYNVGESAFSRSTLLRKLNTGDYEGASKEFSKWTRAGNNPKVQGLVIRRKKEQELFDKDITVKAEHAGPVIAIGLGAGIAANFEHYWPYIFVATLTVAAVTFVGFKLYRKWKERNVK